MNWHGWAEVALTLALPFLLGWPMGVFISRVWNGERTWLDPMLRPVERGFYAALGVRADQSQTWIAYAGALSAKPKLAPSAGTSPTDGGLFVGLLIGMILIFGGLQFFPGLALGPIVEHFQALQALRGL